MDRRRLADWLLRSLVAYALMLVLAGMLGRQYGELLLPVYRVIVRWICTDYRIMGFDLVETRGELRYALVAVGTGYRVIGGQVVPPGGMVTSATLLGHSLQHPVLMFSLLLAWPGFAAWRRAGLCISALPFLLLVECVDVPVVLGGNVLAAVVEQIAPRAVTASPMVQWIDFLGGGGRIVICLLAVAATLLLFRWFESMRPGAPRPPEPFALTGDPG